VLGGDGRKRRSDTYRRSLPGIGSTGGLFTIVYGSISCTGELVVSEGAVADPLSSISVWVRKGFANEPEEERREPDDKWMR
jgi:hypothetical protein